MSTMMTFEYLSQLCQNKDQVYPLCAAKSDAGTSQRFFSNEETFVPNGKLSIFMVCVLTKW